MSPKPLHRRFPALQRLRLRRRRGLRPVQQMTAAECGAACLKMVLGLYGKEVPLKEVREMTGTSRFGTDANTLLRAGRHYGLRGRGVKVDDPEDLQLLERGAILHWKFNHFLVFERYDRKGVQVVDPALGRRHVPHREVARSFTGIALTFEPGPEFEAGRGMSSEGLGRYLIGLLRSSGLIPRILFTSLFVQVLALSVPLLTSVLVDRIVPEQERGLLYLLAVGFGMLIGFQLIATLLRSFLLLHLRTRLDAQMTLDFLDHLVSLPFRFFQQRSAGDLLMRLNSNATIREILTTSGISGLFDTSMVSLYLLILLFVDLRFGLLVALLGAVRIGLFLATRRRQRELMSEALQAQADSRSYQVQMLSGIETLKASGAEHRSVEYWSNLFVRELNVNLARGRLDAFVNGLLDSLSTLSPLLVLLYGGYLVLEGSMSLGTMLALTAIAQGFLQPLSTLVSTAFQFQLMGSYLDRLYDVLQSPTERSTRSGRRMHKLRGRVQIEEVTFRYAPLSPAAVEEVSLVLEPGSLVAVVGGSGSGKSTLASLIAGLYEPDLGRILFDGLDLRELDLEMLRRQLGYVPQTPFLFGLSIRNNISLADPTLPLHQIVEAARLACIDEVISGLPMSYETLLAEHGSSLSGGERQRIALARALVRRPRLLILDEATSALDTITERRVHDNLAGLDCTRLVIAHRLSTIRHADRILVLEGGRIVESGDHEELMESQGRYSELVATQVDDERPVTPPQAEVSTVSRA